MGKNERRVIKDILTEDNLEKIEKTDGISLEYVLHLYHKVGRNGEELNERIEVFFEDNEELIDLLEKNIRLLEEEIETTKDLRKGLLQDKVLDNLISRNSRN